MIWTPVGNACPSDHPTTLDVYKWPGNKAGCVTSTGKVKTGSTSCVSVSSHEAVTLKNWKGGKFCVKRRPMTGNADVTFKAVGDQC